MVRPEWQSQALNHTTDKFTLDLEKINQTPETILNVLKDNILDLKVTIEEELEKKRSIKIIVALHALFHQATDPTFLSEPPPVFKTTPFEILTTTDIEEVLQTIMEQLLKKIDDFETRGSYTNSPVSTYTLTSTILFARQHTSLCLRIYKQSTL